MVISVNRSALSYLVATIKSSGLTASFHPSIIIIIIIIIIKSKHYLTIASQMAALRTCSALLPRNIIFLLLVLIPRLC
jgi:hypothetical protein